YSPWPATTTLPSTRQSAPGVLDVAEHLPTLPMSPPPPGIWQRGQTSGNVVRRQTSENSDTRLPFGRPTPESPVWRLKLPLRTSPGMKRFTTQTGVPTVSSGSGAPKVAPLIEPAPVAPVPVHWKLVVPSHPSRQ